MSVEAEGEEEEWEKEGKAGTAEGNGTEGPGTGNWGILLSLVEAATLSPTTVGIASNEGLFCRLRVPSGFERSNNGGSLEPRG